MPWRDRLAVFAAALWWGSLAAVGFMVVPMLFAHLPTPALAGGMAARLFTALTWLALASGLVLLLCAGTGDGRSRIAWAGGALRFVIAGMLLALLVEFVAAPRIAARQDLRLWHAIGSGMLALQWVCAGVVLWKLAAVRRA